MSTRRQFIQALPATGAAFAVAGHLVLNESPAHAQEAAPLKGHFHPKGKAPSKFTLEVLKQAKATLPFADKRDFEEQKKGLIAPMKDLKIMADAGHVAWDMERFQFLEQQEEFDSIHPSLLRQSVLNNNYGLYEVIPGIYQVRGFDLSDISFVRGKTGWIVFDPLVTAEVVRAAWKLFQEHVGKGLPVSAVIYSHTHGDHWGGVRGIVEEADVRSGKIPVIAPIDFMEHTISENVYAGNAMNRRLFYQYGLLLPASPYGYVGQGLGQAVSAGAMGLIAPTRYVEKDIEEFEVDGVKMVFQNTPNTEAPREMNTYIPEMKALWMAENVIASLHNIYTLRGAPVRDPLNWSKYISQALYRFGLEAEVMFASHHWPRWGNDRIQEVLRGQRDLYAHMNNQVLHLANQGVTINEIHNVYEVPKSLQSKWYCRGYHGSPRAQQPRRHPALSRVLGLQPDDAHPALAERVGAALRRDDGRRREDHRAGRKLHDEGKYLLAQEILNKLVQAEPQNQAAKDLLADVFEQIGYQQENPGLRNSFLAAAYELRTGIPQGETVEVKQPRRDPGDVHRVVPQLPRHSHGQPQGRGDAVHDQPDHAGQRREVPGRAGERHAHEHQGLSCPQARPDPHDQSLGSRADDDGREDARSPDRGRNREGGRRRGILKQLASTMVDFDPRFEIMPGTKARGTEVLRSDVHYVDPYEAVPRQTIAE